MNKTLRIIPLRLTPHSDRTSILQAYSRECGAVSFAVTAGNGLAASRRRALLQPLTPLEVEATIRPGRDIHSFKEPRALMAPHGILSSPERRAVAMFLTEALQTILRQSEADTTTYDYIAESVGQLNDPRTPAANFHLAFLVGLATVLGIAPDLAGYCPGMLFDMLDGCFRRSAALHGHTLSPAESLAAMRIMRMNRRNMGLYRMTGTERAATLDRILEYYTLHYADLSAMKSPAVLHSLLN